MHSVIGGRRRSSGEPWLQQQQQQRPSVDLPSLVSGHFQDTSTPERRKSHHSNGNHTNMILTCSRQEFLPGESSEPGISYHRKGGVFVSKCGVATILIVFLALIAAVGILVYFFAPCKDEEKIVVEDDLSWNVGEIHVRNADDNIRLLKTVIPSYYRVKIKPNFTSLTFEGKVTITLSTHKPHVKYISLHSKGLKILNGTTLIEQSIAPRNFNRTKRSTNDDDTDDEPSKPNLYERLAQSRENDHKIRKASLVFSKQVLEHEDPMYTITDRRPMKHENNTMSEFFVKVKKIKITGVQINPSIDRIVFALETYLKPHVNYTLDLSFTGGIDDSLTGFYYSTYRDLTDHKIETIGVTQFEPTSARKCFPCFDEPNFKASFELSVACKPNQTVLSNMPLATNEPVKDEGLVWYHFERSVPMPPYLVAFTISDFISKEGELTTNDEGDNNNDVPFLIWCRKELVNQTQYGSKIGPKLLNFYEKYFGVPYALPKLDLVAIPDFAAGAMENWGLITFKETHILIDPDSDSIQAKKSVAMTLAHELAHQWFGNLVTMQWWTDVWLNEGFATYMEYIGIDAVEPSFKMVDEFILDRISVMVSDSVESTRPVSSLVNDETQIGQIFDDISYIKSASLLRMLNSVITKEFFTAGLIKYMDKWKFKNAVQDDLWQALNEVINQTTVFPKTFGIAEFMDTWTLQSGYPVINVERNYIDGSVTITQHRFCLSGQSEKYKELWYVPITYGLGNTNSSSWETVPTAWIEKTESTQLVLPDNLNNTWVYFNVMGIGHYRVNYDLHNWKLIKNTLYENPKQFPIHTRVQLIDDAFNLARAGQLNYTVALDLTKYLINTEIDMIPWFAALENLEYLDLYLQTNQMYYQFQEYISHLITPSLKILGYTSNPEDSPQNVTLRNQLIYWACKIEDNECINWALRHFNNWTNQKDPDKINPIPFGIRHIVYSTIVKMGSKKEFNFLYDRFENTNDPEAQSQIIHALPSSRNSWHIHLLFEYAITNLDLSLQQDFWSGVKSELASEMAFNFIISDWPKVFNKFKNADDQILQHVITAAFSRISYEQKLRQFKRFIRANKEDLKSVSQQVQKYLERGVLQIQWRKTKIQDIEEWLTSFLENKTDKNISPFKTDTNKNNNEEATDNGVSSFVDDDNEMPSYLQSGPLYMG